jgi:hypothetical protein
MKAVSANISLLSPTCRVNLKFSHSSLRLIEDTTQLSILENESQVIGCGLISVIAVRAKTEYVSIDAPQWKHIDSK